MRPSTPRSRALTAWASACVVIALLILLDVGAGGGEPASPPPTPAPGTQGAAVGVDHAHADGHTATPPLSDATRAANDAAVEDGTYDASGIVLGAAGAPARITCLTHQRGAARSVSKIGLGVVHTTEGPNVRGLADVHGLCAWFRSQQLSATWIVDDEGNSATVVPLSHAPWTQWKWNPWSCSIEFVGYAARAASAWTDAQLREGARLMAQCFKTAGVPIRWGAVAGTGAGASPRIVTTGVIAHAELGYNGGSHHDPGASFPRARFLELMRVAAGGRDGEPSLAGLTAGEARAARTLLAERRTAKRHGGWERVHPSHLRRAIAAKRALERANVRIHAAAARTGWEPHRRRERHEVLHALI